MDRAEKVDKERILDYMKEIAEERDLLVLILDSMIEGMIVIDEEEKVVFVNQSARSILDLGDGSTTPDMPLAKMLNHPGLLSLCRSGIDNSTPLPFLEYELRLPKGRTHVQINIIPLQNREERFGTLFFFIDETEHKEREQKLLEAEKLAALATLTAGMSHEIRNPLNSLSIHLQLLQRHLKKKEIHDAEVEEELSIFNTEIQRLNGVIESFLGAVRPSHPAIKLFDLNSLVTETLTLMEPEFRENGIRVFLHEEGDWPYIEGDRSRLKQSLINLLRNAIEAIVAQTQEERQRKANEIVLSMARRGDKVTLAITDTGKGIPPKDLPHIFEAYFTTKARGTGLGLMIVDRIIREHQGTISAQSELNEGTQIEIALPVAAESPRLLEHDAPKTHDVENSD
ncbi:MAG: ATP-binding protein [Candidatus Omnitrophota bacterium]